MAKTENLWPNTQSISESIYEHERVEQSNSAVLSENRNDNDNVDETRDETDNATSREDAAIINGITHGII